MEHKERAAFKIFVQIGIYLIGVAAVSLGIVLCKKSNLGISPVSSIPFVLEEAVPLSFGTLTMLFHGANILLQMVCVKRLFCLKIWMQIPLAFLFGQVIDLFQKRIVFDGTVLFNQAAALVLSIFFTALGMVCMIEMNLIQNPPDGLVQEISRKLGKELGRVKVGYDILCVGISIVISLILLGKVKGFGIGTILSAVFVGKTVTWLRNGLRKNIKRREDYVVRTCKRHCGHNEL